MSPFCAAVDWGTSSFRMWLIDRDGGVLGERRSAEGMVEAASTGFDRVLEGHLAALDAPGDLPVIVCGMAGARQGWVEAGYVDTPADVGTLAAGSVRPTSGRDVRILPGVAQRDRARPDVMRGEETQIAGLLDSGMVSGSVCLPGTHSKWAEVSNGRIAGFSTFMTGETFALFQGHSILKHDADGRAAAGDAAFADAVSEALATPARILTLLFSVRSRSLLGLARDNDGASRLSGLLLGLEIAGARERLAGSTVTLVSSGDLRHIYDAALRIAGIDVAHVGAEDATLRGLLKAAHEIWR